MCLEKKISNPPTYSSSWNLLSFFYKNISHEYLFSIFFAWLTPYYVKKTKIFLYWLQNFSPSDSESISMFSAVLLNLSVMLSSGIFHCCWFCVFHDFLLFKTPLGLRGRLNIGNDVRKHKFWYILMRNLNVI